MQHLLQWSKQSVKDLKSISKKDSLRIIEKVKWFCDQQLPLNSATPLKGRFENLYKFRVGNYRIILQSNKKGKLNILLILKIGHRKDVYK